jgi:hypothetical protein
MAQKMYSEIQLDLEIKGYIAALEKAKQANAKLKSDYDKKIDGMNKKSGALMSAFKKMAGVIGAAFATQQIISFTKEAIVLAAKAEGIKDAFAKLNDGSLLDDLRKATRGTVDDVTLMAKAVQANNFRIALENLPTYFEFAQQRARATGESVDYLVDSIVRGIGRKSALILDNLGISASELNEQLKITPDYADAVGAIIQREMAKSGTAISTTVDTIDQLKASMTNLKTEVGDMFNDVFAAPLKKTADSLSSVISGLSDLRAELDLGGANKDLANIIRGNISMASGTAGGYFMSALFGGRKVGKKEIIIEKTEPIRIKAAQKAVVELGESIKRTTLDAEQMWKTLVMPTATADLGKKSFENQGWRTSVLFADPKQLADAKEAMTGFTQTLDNQYQVAGMLQDTFSSLFSAGIDGWDNFGKAALNAIAQMVIKLAALAATFAVLSLIPGFAAFLEAVGGFSGFMRSGMGFTAGNVSPSGVGIGGGMELVVKGTSLATVTNRGSNIIYKNT